MSPASKDFTFTFLGCEPPPGDWPVETCRLLPVSIQIDDAAETGKGIPWNLNAPMDNYLDKKQLAGTIRELKRLLKEANPRFETISFVNVERESVPLKKEKLGVEVFFETMEDVDRIGGRVSHNTFHVMLPAERSPSRPLSEALIEPMQTFVNELDDEFIGKVKTAREAERANKKY